MQVETVFKSAKLLVVPCLISLVSIAGALAVRSQPLPSMKHGLGHGGIHMMPPLTAGFPGAHLMVMPPPPPPPLGMEIAALIHCEDIDLTDDQISRLADIKRATNKKVEPAMSKLRSLERDYRDALISGKEGESLKEELLASKKTLDSAMLDSAQDMVSVLTAEQKKKLKLALDKRELFPFPGPKPLDTKQFKDAK